MKLFRHLNRGELVKKMETPRQNQTKPVAPSSQTPLTAEDLAFQAKLEQHNREMAAYHENLRASGLNPYV